MTTWIIVVIIFWVECGVLAYGICLHHFETRFPAFPGHYFIAVLEGVLGPGGLIAGFLLADRPLGWRARAIPLEEKRRLHQQQWPSVPVNF
mgnify:CR=1 FL=1